MSMNEIIPISHKIELKPNNAAKTHFRKAFGCARLAYNWGLAKWQENYKLGTTVSLSSELTDFIHRARLAVIAAR